MAVDRRTIDREPVFDDKGRYVPPDERGGRPDPGPPRWALFGYTEVPDYDEPDHVLFRRWRVFETPWFGVYVHHLMRSDSPRRGLHDHPWPFMSVTLRGRYRECVAVGANIVLESEYRRVRFKRATDLHRVCLDDGDTRGVWTVVVRGPRLRRWGFWRPQTGWVSNLEDDGPMARHAGLTKKGWS